MGSCKDFGLCGLMASERFRAWGCNFLGCGAWALAEDEDFRPLLCFRILDCRVWS